MKIDSGYMSLNKQNLNLSQPIFLVRHGQSEYNVDERLGGDPGLTERGKGFSKRLGNWISQHFEDPKEALHVWTSTMKRAIQTAEPVTCNVVKRWRELEEISVGICDGLTYEEVERHFPEEFQSRQQDKLRYRYPQGESYEDVIGRLEPIIQGLEEQPAPTLVVGHQAVLRCLYGRLCSVPPEDIPHIEIPSQTVIKLTLVNDQLVEQHFSI